jgi:peptidoglycan hydrolase FlgJ
MDVTAAGMQTRVQGGTAQILQEKAIALEASFLAEMLQYAGLGQGEAQFGGGIGEEQFGSFLRQEQAQAMAEKGGIGLAESIFHALMRGQEASAAP